ncbi:aldehyde dehydrogenase family protein [Streptomyces sp. NPDC090499]|uniref:aldehyde dehydrogenase family protein n=1 Tax=Streptomyces sp. NPDC090499 TaxID=3365965 RepID=UPI00382E1D5D
MAEAGVPLVGVRQLDALGPKGAFRARNRREVTDVSGTAVAELSLVPAPFVNRSLSALRRSRPAPVDERVRRIIVAAGLFATAELDGLTADTYRYLVARTGGVPISEVTEAVGRVADRLRAVQETLALARPAGAVSDLCDPLTRTGRAAWTRKGEVFAVHSAGNHPGTHSLWPEALALGYRVAVRPSRREPFTPHRLVTALRRAGFGDDVVFLPTDHERASALVRGADLALVYGGDDVVRAYGNDRHVLLQGPGRSKVLITADVDWRDHLDTIVDSVAGRAGVGCVNATAVLIEGDPAPLCEALTERLAALPSLPPEHPRAVLPVQPVSTARAIADYLRGRAGGARPWLGADTVVDELSDGGAVLRPAVHQLDSSGAPELGAELPFPCVWVAPWRAEEGVVPLRDSLVLTALTRRDDLLDQLLAEPTVANLYTGDVATHWMRPGLPHDGYLADFLMRTKAVVRDG